jgi:UDP-N-acetylmuramate--alanine ligase
MTKPLSQSSSQTAHSEILQKAKHVHFIGIGGIGISAVARMMLHDGKIVSGSDRDESEITRELAHQGAKIFIGQKAENIQPGTDLVIYTIAIPDDNPELAAARAAGIFCMTYPQSLHEISKDKYTIAVSGTHGKTTTTAMIAKMLIDAKLDPTVIVGSLLKDVKSNFVAGKSQYFVVEACEYRRSFLNIEPKILVITNIDNDHLDYYKDIADIQSAFIEMVAKLGPKDYLVCDRNGPNMKEVVATAKCNIIHYPLFDHLELKMKVPGAHNIKNAQAAFAVSAILKMDADLALDSLNHFSGTWRRFEYKGETDKGAIVYDDYGHHPTEIKATLQGARELFPKERIIVAFQPHLYSRTKLLLADFASCFSAADEVILAPIFAAREPDDPSISSDILRDEIAKNGVYVLSEPSLDAVEQYLRSKTKKGDVVITMGAGELYKIAGEIVKK